MTRVDRRRFLETLAAGAALTSLPAHARKQQSQHKVETLRIVTGFTPGGTSDTLCRRVAEGLTGGYAQTAVVDNRAGAGGQVAINLMRAAPNDGTTILQTPASMLVIYPHIYRKLSYDPFTDLVPLTLACNFEFGFAVGPMVPESVKSMADFFAWCKENPSKGNFGSPAAGSIPHFLGVLAGQAGGLDLRHVPFRGTQPAILDMIGGQIAAVSGPVGEFTQHVEAGKCRLLATSASERSRFAPNVPTYAEQGLKDLQFREWFGFFAPAKTPPEIIEHSNAALREALAAPAVIEGLAVMGLEAESSTPEELGRRMREDYDRWAPIVKKIGFTADS